MTDAPAPTSRRARAITFRNGGWLLIIAPIPALVVLVWGVAGAFVHDAFHLGDGNTIESYGFDLDNLLVDRTLVVPGTDTRDRIPALFRAKHIAGADVARINAEERGKYLVSSDRVVGVIINGEQRAYPIRVLDVHEVINDTLGGVPIAVTYSPWADSVAVFDRRVGDETLQFAVSGLLYNENLLMYDRHQEPGNESLWSQLEARAISGSYAAKSAELARLPFTLCHWREWLADHPETTVIERNPVRDLKKHYDRNTYGPYFSEGHLRKDSRVAPLPPEGTLGYMSPVVVVQAGGAQAVYSVEQLEAAAGEKRKLTASLGGERLTFRLSKLPRCAQVTNTSGESCVIARCFWFGWYATHPDTSIASIDES